MASSRTSHDVTPHNRPPIDASHVIIIPKTIPPLMNIYDELHCTCMLVCTLNIMLIVGRWPANNVIPTCTTYNNKYEHGQTGLRAYKKGVTRHEKVVIYGLKKMRES